ncbi:MAG: hypothetical protein WC729_09335 [Sphingomonas sp.]|jgi:hypothetical protein|uniref:beta strand repeat-containing protein n=1 Tax=Sphingomonas sp. TaxID=28214 RepID=UPI003562AFF7
MKHAPSRRSRRLLGSAGLTLATLLAAAPASAQLSQVQASGPNTLASDQANRGAPTFADGDGTIIQIVPGATVQGSVISVSGNAVSAAARGNSLADSLAPDALTAAGDGAASHLAAGSGGVVARADSLIASSQRNLGSEVQAVLLAPRHALDAGSVTASRFAITANSQEADALGNAGMSALSLTGGLSGGGIVALQKNDATSPVAARSLGVTRLTAGQVQASDLSLSRNLVRALGYGNSVDNALSATGINVAVPANGDAAAIVPAGGDGDPAVNAAYAVLSNQETGATVKARTGDDNASASFGVTLTGDLYASSVGNDENAVVAAGYGNRSANALDLAAASVVRGAVGDGGALANVTGVQRIDDSRVVALSLGGTVTDVLGGVAASGLSASRNSLLTQATGNLASGNLLTVKADTIDVPGGDPLSGGVVGTAVVSGDGTASVSAPISVLGVQEFGHGFVGAMQLNGGVRLVAENGVSEASLVADGNLATAAATGNMAVNGATLEATSLRSAADVDSLQTGDGTVQVVLGQLSSRAGAVVAPQSGVSDSTLSASGNSATGTALGNAATNSLAVAANLIADGSGHDDAEAGSLPAGYGAAATFALANNQKLGEPSIDGSSAAHVSSEIYGQFGITGSGATDHSSLIVDDNAQRANALGNSSVNRLTVSATSLAADGAPAAGTALSSSQYGEAVISSTSDLNLTAKGDLDASSVSLSGNANQALAAVNDVDNGLAIDAAGTGSVTGGAAQGDIGSLGSAGIAGDNVLASTQFATGSATASARTSIANVAGTTGLNASRFTIAGNGTSADASANRAINKVSVSAGPAGQANAGLASSQMSVADVTASAVTTAAYVFAVAPGATVSGSSIAIGGNSTTALARGNVADNQLSLSGAGAAVSSAVPAVRIGRFDSTAGAAALLLNGQSNYGAVTASAGATSYGVPLNLAAAPFSASSVALTGNNVSANAYGNAASNQVTIGSIGQLPTAALVNVQANYGPVTALVTGANYRVAAGPVTGSALSITGNQLAAIATGNQAINTVLTAR